MAAPPTLDRIDPEDVPELPDAERLLRALNPFLSATTNALRGGLSFEENFAGVVRDVRLTPPEDWRPVQWANGWQDNTAYGPAVWRQGLDGRVYLRGVAKRTNVPSSGTPMATGLPAPVALETFAGQTDAGVGTADLGADGALTYYSGGVLRWPLTGFAYDAADRTPPAWPVPVDVLLDSDGAPFSGRPGQVIVLRAVEESTNARAVVQSLVWSSTTIDAEDEGATGLRISSVWGLRAGVPHVLTLLVLPE